MISSFIEYISNIPDYCGLLTAFVSCGMHLKTHKDFSCVLNCNVLFNTGIWQPYDEYVFSSTMLRGKEEVEEILGFKNISGGLFGKENNRWILNPNWKIPERNKLFECLTRIYLGIAYPAERKTREPYFEFSPCTMNVFILTLQYLKSKGIPGHWISQLKI